MDTLRSTFSSDSNITMTSHDDDSDDQNNDVIKLAKKSISIKDSNKCKLIIHLPAEDDNTSNIMINHAQDEFFRMFGYDRNTFFPIPLSNLFGPQSNLDRIGRIHSSVITRQTASESIILYKLNRISWLCQVDVLSITGNQYRGDLDTEFAPNSSTPDRWAVITITGV